MILYFSGTGNTRYCAEYLGKKLEDEVVDIAGYTRMQKTGDFHSEKPYVICMPVYCATLPLFAYYFLKKSVFRGSDRMYFLTTYGGSEEKGGDSTPVLACKLSKELHKTYCGTWHVEMPVNMITMFSLQSDEEIRRRFSAMDSVLDRFAEHVKKGISADGFSYNKTTAWLITKTIDICYALAISDKKFYATDKCVGCGLCEKLCPLSNITMANGKPEWNGSCTQCMACICRCPNEAIEYGKKTQGRARYTFESFSKRLKQ